MNSPTKFPAGTVLKVAVEEWIPHVKLMETNSTLQITGPMANMLDMLAEALNFRYTLHRPPDGSWGAPNETGQWNGMIGMVMRDEAQIALGPFIISKQRAEAVQFSTIFIIDYFRLFLSRDAPRAEPLGFVKTFTQQVWYSILATFLVASIMFVVAKYQSTFRQRWHKSSLLRNFMESIFEVFGLFLNQELVYDVTGKGFRVLLMSLFVMDLVVVKFYSSALTSVLTVKISYGNYDSLDELFSENKYSVIIEDSTVITAGMKTSNAGLMRRMADKYDEGVLLQYTVKDLFSAVENNVKDGRYALFVEETTCFKLTSDYFSRSGICEFYVGADKIFPGMFGILGAWNSSIIPTLNPVIARMVEGDFYNQWLRQEITNATTCLSRDSFFLFSMSPFDLKSVWVIFALLAIGLSLSTIAYCAEIGVHRFWARKSSMSDDYYGEKGNAAVVTHVEAILNTNVYYAPLSSRKFISVRHRVVY